MIPESKREGAQLSIVESFIGPEKKRKPRASPSVGAKAWIVAVSEVNVMMVSGEWENASAVHFVALYAILHQRVYGVDVAELNVARERTIAKFAAYRMLTNEFSGNVDSMVTFIKWCWLREQKSVTWRRNNPERDNGFRIGWKYQFNGKLLSDWRMMCTRGTG